MKMKKQKPILQILANCRGVYEVGVRALAADYDKAERLSAAIRPAIAIIDKAIGEISEHPAARRAVRRQTLNDGHCGIARSGSF